MLMMGNAFKDEINELEEELIKERQISEEIYTEYEKERGRADNASSQHLRLKEENEALKAKLEKIKVWIASTNADSQIALDENRKLRIRLEEVMKENVTLQETVADLRKEIEGIKINEAVRKHVHQNEE